MNNQLHGEELCKNPVDVHAVCKQPKTFDIKKEVRLEKRFYLRCRLSP